MTGGVSPAIRDDSIASLRRTWDQLDAWLRERDFEGYDPYDLLSSVRLPRSLRATSRRRQVVIQIGKRSPLDLRRLLGVPPHRNSKALALSASAYAKLQKIERDPMREAVAVSLLEELERRGVRGRGLAAWGYEFDVQTRWAFYPKGTPNIIVTTFVGNSFLDWYDLTRDPKYLATASAAVNYLNEELLGVGGDYYSYVPDSPVLVHNANVLGCALASRVAQATGDLALARSARAASEVSLAAQDAFGLWPYGRGPGLEWVDGFHTAYVLDGLCELCSAGADQALEAAVRRGFSAYVRMFFGSGGEPRYTPQSPYPLDIHSASTAIDVLSRRTQSGDAGLVLARRVYVWALDRMLDPRGFFYFQRHRLYTNRIPYVRWSQAHMLRAIASLLDTLLVRVSQI
jgi:hypothetical protein